MCLQCSVWNTCCYFVLDLFKTLISWYFVSVSFGIHVTQHVTGLWLQILLCTKGSVLGVRVCQKWRLSSSQWCTIAGLSIVITLTAKVFITQTLRCFSSANSSILTLGFSNSWGICHDMGFLVRGNVHVSSNIWFHGSLRCLGWVSCGCL